MTTKELMIQIKKDESIIKNLVKNIRKEMDRTEFFDNGNEAKMKIIQKEYADACLRMNKIRNIYETDNTDTESN